MTKSDKSQYQVQGHVLRGRVRLYGPLAERYWSGGASDTDTSVCLALGQGWND
jgi:hypothetical protein